MLPLCRPKRKIRNALPQMHTPTMHDCANMHPSPLLRSVTWQPTLIWVTVLGGEVHVSLYRRSYSNDTV